VKKNLKNLNKGLKAEPFGVGYINQIIFTQKQS
jgi:hypothetical protein